MSGKFLLDTNAIICAIDRKLTLPVGHYAVSVIAVMELLSWPGLGQEDEQQLRSVIGQLEVVELAKSIQESAIRIRRATSLKLPDSIISATAIYGGYLVVTDDQKLADKHVGETMTLHQLLTAGSQM